MLISISFLIILTSTEICEGQIQCSQAATCPPANGPMDQIAPGSNSTIKQICKTKHCYCEADKYMNFTTKSCESRADYAAEYNISGYTALPNGYCSKTSDCVEGLVCKNTVCYCPEGCTFVSENLECDCGAEHGPALLIAVTVIFGALNLFGWYRLFSSLSDKPNDSEGKVYSNSPYRSNRVSSSSMTPVVANQTNTTNISTIQPNLRPASVTPNNLLVPLPYPLDQPQDFQTLQVPSPAQYQPPTFDYYKGVPNYNVKTT